MTVAELHNLMVERFDKIDDAVAENGDRIRTVELGIAKRSGVFAVLVKLGLILLGVGGTVAGAAIITSL